MFNKSKSKKISNTPNPASRSLSVLSASATIIGEIRIEDDLRIDGNVDGNIYSGGKVVIGPEGCVKGKITGKSIEITGKIIGEIIVSDIAILRASCHYEGQITTHNIEIEPGASFWGNCKMEGEGVKKTTKNERSVIDNNISQSIDIKEIEKI